MYYQVGNYLFKTIEMVVLTAKDLPFQVTGLIFLVFLRSWDMKKNNGFLCIVFYYSFPAC